jgi:hypothetical protein
MNHACPPSDPSRQSLQLKPAETITIPDKVQHAQTSKVVVFLVNHKNSLHVEAIRLYLTNLSNILNSVLLVEDPDEVKEWSQMIPTICWENEELLARISKTKKTFQDLAVSLNSLTDIDYDRQKKELAVKQTLVNAKVLNEIANTKTEYNKICSYLNEPNTYRHELEEQTIFLRGLLKKVYRVFVHQTIEKTFPQRQTDLMNCIEDHLANDMQGKIIVVCGASHGDPTRSRFSTETKRLLDFLESHGPYDIFNLESQCTYPINLG